MTLNASRRQNPHVVPEGEGPTLTVRLPARVHWLAAGLAIGLGAIWFFFEEAALKNTLGILAAVAAIYSMFYARTSILSARERERRFETIKFSGVFSDASHIAARFAVSSRFGQILNQQTGSDGEKRAAAVALMSSELRQALKVRESPGTYQGAAAATVNASGTAGTTGTIPAGKDLIDDAMLILDYFEDLAVGIEEGVLDSETARKLLRSPLMSFWDLLKGLVEQFRARDGRATLYEKMEKLAKTWPKD